MMNTGVENILHEVRKAIVGKDAVLEKILMTILSGGHVLLDDVPGTGKTTTALAFSRALGLQYGRIQFTPDVLPSDITGFTMFNCLFSTFLVRLPLVIWFSTLPGVTMLQIGIAAPLASLVQIIIQLIYYRTGRWSRAVVQMEGRT